MISDTFFGGMGALTTNFRPEPSKERNALYQQALADVSDEAFSAAVGHIIREDEFFPTVARIRKVAAELERQAFERRIFAETLLREGRTPDEQRRLIAGWEANR